MSVIQWNNCILTKNKLIIPKFDAVVVLLDKEKREFWNGNSIGI